MDPLDTEHGRKWIEEELVLKSDRTQHLYKTNMLRFLEWADIDADTLFKRHWENLQSDVPTHRGDIPRLVSRYMKELEDQGKAPNTQLLVAKAVSSFFKMFDVPFTIRNRPKAIEIGKDRMKKEHIRTLMDYSGNIRNTSILMFLKDSGLRVSDTALVKIGHVFDAIRTTKDYHLFDMVQSKTGEIAKVIIGPEAIEWVQKWFTERERMGLSTSPDEFLYCALEYRPEQTRNGDTISEVNIGDPIDGGTISTLFYRMVIKAGLQGENVSAHSIRKYHQTMLEASGMPDTWIALIQGRKIADSRRAYTRPTNEQLIEAYKEAYPELALSEPTTNEQIQDLQQENEKLHETISQLQEQITQMKEDYWMVRAIRPDASPELKARLRKLILTPDPEMETALRKAEEHYPINDTLLEGKIRNMVKSMLTERNGKASYTKIESSNEEQLLKLLNEGWDIYKELNGKIILRR